MVKSFLNLKKTAGVLAAVSLTSGFFFLDQGTTGNVVLNGDVPMVDLISIIGLALVFCSAVLAVYAIKK